MKTNLPFYLRRRHVYDELGVENKQLAKLIRFKILTPVYLYPGARAFFLRDEVLQIQQEQTMTREGE